ncbi:MAG: ATP synthase F0 subunit C [Phycisphaeraceae bacterium]
MKKYVVVGALALAAVLFTAAPAMAQEAPTVAQGSSWVFPSGDQTKAFGVAIGMGVMVLGAALGIGRIGGSAVESMARQPEAAARIFTAMLLSAALIEGFTFFALLIQFTL